MKLNPAHKGMFTAKAKQAGMGIQEFARHVLANKKDFDTRTIREAVFAQNQRQFKRG
jgi:hypothetical protein